jgi:hypothetical protein
MSPHPAPHLDCRAPRRFCAPMSPIATDEQLDAVMAAAAPLAPADRGPFLEAVAAALRGREVGDGAVYLAITAAQRQFLSSADRYRGRAVGGR